MYFLRNKSNKTFTIVAIFLLFQSSAGAQESIVIEGQKEQSPLETLQLQNPKKVNDLNALNAKSEENVKELILTPSFWVEEIEEPEVDSSGKK